MYKKLLLTSALVAGFASNALAHPHGPTVTLGGHIDTQAGYRDQKTNYDTTTIAAGGAKVHEFALVNDTKLHVKVDGKHKGMKYGGMVVLNTDTSNNKTNHAGTSSFSNAVGYTTMGYVETSMGRMEAGTHTGAAESMKLNASSVAHATGGVDGDWRWWVNPLIQGAGTAPSPTGGAVYANFVTTPNLPSNFDTGGEDRAAKFTFYTNMWNGFKAGVSYIPDTEQHGTVSHSHIVTDSAVANTADAWKRGGYKDVFSGGLHYHFKAKGMKVALAALGETGSAKNAGTVAAANGGAATGVTDKREDLAAYELGAKVHYNNFTVAGSYGDWGKSGAYKTVASGATTVTGKADAHYWNVGASYEQGPWGVSVGYFESEQGNSDSATGRASRSELQTVSVGVDYKLAPGFMPYAEATFFDMDEKRATGTNGKNSGAVVLAGTKLVF